MKLLIFLLSAYEWAVWKALRPVTPDCFKLSGLNVYYVSRYFFSRFAFLDERYYSFDIIGAKLFNLIAIHWLSSVVRFKWNNGGYLKKIVKEELGVYRSNAICIYLLHVLRLVSSRSMKFFLFFLLVRLSFFSKSFICIKYTFRRRMKRF